MKRVIRRDREKILLNTVNGSKLKKSALYQSLEGLIEAIGLPADKICTYCWTGRE